MKKLKYLFIPIIIAAIVINIISVRLERDVDSIVTKKDFTKIYKEYGNKLRDHGVRLLKESNDNIIVLGSSELSSGLNQHIKNYFPNDKVKYNAIPVGRAYTQDLQHASILNSVENVNEDSKVVLILSMQWFLNGNKIGGEEFSANFSPIQFYNFMFSKEIPKDMKHTYAKRHSELLKASGKYSEEYVMSKLYLDDNPLRVGVRSIFYPYFKLKSKLLVMKDNDKVIREAKSLPEYKKPELKVNDWEKEKSLALDEAMKTANNNQFKIDNEYYDKYISKDLNRIKNIYQKQTFEGSPEFKDLQLLLDTFKIKGVKPLVTLMPVNGRYYDYVGVNSDKRQALYSEIKKIVLENGFDYIDYSDRDYEDYFIHDSMHVGYKGWVDLSEKVEEYFKRR